MFDDDELPNAVLWYSDVGRAWVKPYGQKEAPLAANTVRVLLEVSASMASASTPVRAPLDLVVVLDGSGSMRGNKLSQLKMAMQFVVRKLCPADRLSVVTFSRGATRLCPLRAMSKAAKSDLKGIVDGLAVAADEDEGTNIEAGLETGLQILDGRQHTAGRTGNILLLSAGEQNHGDARQVSNPQNFTIYTVAFGAGADMKLLHELAANGGTFNFVPENGGMAMIDVLSQLLAGLLTVAVQDLHLILSKPTRPGHDLDKIVDVAPGDFNQQIDSQSGAITVKFGDLFSGEVCRVIVDLLLKEASSTHEAKILEVAISYKNDQGTRSKFILQGPHVWRTPTASSSSRTHPLLEAEEARRQHAHSISMARPLADEKKLDDARDKLNTALYSLAQNALMDIPWYEADRMEELRRELQGLLDRMESQEVYEAEGRPYALASETSHARQRFAARGVEGIRLFATPRMDAYLKDARRFTEEPNASLPISDEDDEEYLTADLRLIELGGRSTPGGFYNMTREFPREAPCQKMSIWERLRRYIFRRH
ncbi:hypothetical protein ACP70R_000352 [Stipagrostis hirtigluma subsp. patula]